MDRAYTLSWLDRAKSNLARCRAGRVSPEVFWEDLCFDAQQAVEKALLAHLALPIPKTHDLDRLLKALEAAGLTPPQELREHLPRLNAYAVAARYPGELEAATQEDWAEALALAEKALAWAEAVIGV